MNFIIGFGLIQLIDLSKEQLKSIENSLTALLEKVGASEDINLDKLINLQKTQINYQSGMQ